MDLYELQEDGSYVIQGRATIDEFNEIMHSHISDEFADTLGGYIYGQLGRVPQSGEKVVNDGLEFTVKEVVARRILTVQVEKVHPAEEKSDTEGKNGTTDD